MTHSIFTSRWAVALRTATALMLSLSLCALAQPSSTEDALVLAQDAITKRDWATAEGILQPLTKSQPNNPFVFYEMAQVYENTSRPEAAKQIYQGIASIQDAAKRQYTIVVRSPNVNYMTSLIGLAQSKLNALNASTAAKPVVVSQATAPKEAASATAIAPSAANNPSAEVTAAMQNWAKAWANKDVNGYFASYVSNFQRDSASPAAWKKLHKSRIESKKTIALDFADIQVLQINANKVQTTFQQKFSSDSYSDVVNKTLVWVKQGSNWLIEQESVK